MSMWNSEIVRWAKANPLWFWGGLLAAVAGVYWAAGGNKGTGHVHAVANKVSVPPVYTFTQPLPLSQPQDAARVLLGERLFHDVRLSSDNTVGCFSCHDLGTGGVDNKVHSVGVNGALGTINAPTVFNSGYNFLQFWDGRAPTLEDQVEGPVNNPKEMASNWPQVIGKLSDDAGYRTTFAQIYRDGITAENIKDAIATFERSLVTPNSRFDRYLRGEEEVLDAEEKRGVRLFQSYGCASCHQGINLGGNMYERMGMMGDYFKDRGEIMVVDNGRYNLTHDIEHMNEFKVPSLRNIARTAPYFHDGSAKTLEQAVRVMAKYQIGRPVPDEDIRAIVRFLESLTGEYKGVPL